MRLANTIVLLVVFFGMFGIAMAYPPLHEAARDGRLDDIRRLIAQNPNIVDQYDEDGNNAIHWAISTGQTLVVDYLLQNGVSPDVAKSEAARRNNMMGFTPLHEAAHDGQIDCLKIILHYHPKLDSRDQNDQTPLHTAVWDNQIEAAKLLIDSGVPVNITRKDKVIPLEIAAYFGYRDMARMLLANGADVNWRVYEGNAPIHQAARTGHTDMIQLLLEHGANLQARRDDGQTPLHVAAATGQLGATRFLLALGADINATMKGDITPLMLANKSGQAGTAGVIQAFLKSIQETRVLVDARRLSNSSLVGAKNIVYSTVYHNDFEEEMPGDEWSTQTTSPFYGPLKTTVIPNTGKRFLGEFGNQNVRLALKKLPPHSQVTLVMNLCIIHTWDGNSEPDLWEARVEGGQNLLRASFMNSPPGWRITPIQSFPGDYPLEFHPGRTGALMNDVLHLGTTPETPEGKRDAIYQLKFTFAHNKPTLMLNFEGKNLQELNDESWGIRNIEVRVGHAIAPKSVPSTKKRKIRH